MQDPLSIRNKNCKLCPLNEGATSVCVSGEGPALREVFGGPKPYRLGEPLPVMILGEAPGREEDSAGRPFVGASGKLLRSTLKLEKVPYEQCYITNTVKCYPHGTPTKDQIAICSKKYLYREIQDYGFLYILAVGAKALSSLTPECALADARGRIVESWVGAPIVFPIWHPAYILRNRSKQPEWRDDIAKFRALLEVDLKLEG